MGVIDDYIERCDKTLQSGNRPMRMKLISEIGSVFVKEIRETGFRLCDYENDTNLTVEYCRGWLANLKEQREYELELKRAGSTSASITATSGSQSSSDAHVSVRITVDQAVEMISGIDDDSLTDEAKDEIASLLAQAKGSAKKNPKRFADLVSKALAKAGDCAKAIQAIAQCAAAMAEAIG